MGRGEGGGNGELGDKFREGIIRLLIGIINRRRRSSLMNYFLALIEESSLKNHFPRH